MSESRTFMLSGVGAQTVVEHLADFLRSEKGMEVQSTQTPDGYIR